MKPAPPSLHQRLEERLAQLGGGAGGITDHAAAAQLTGQPGTGGLALQAPALRWLLDGSVRLTLRADQILRQMKHEAGLRQTRMQPPLPFRFGNPLGDPFRPTPEKTGQHRQVRSSRMELAGRHLQQGDLPAMAIEQHQPLEARRRQVAAHRDHQAQQQLWRQAEGAGKTAVLVGEAEALGGQLPDGQIVGKPLQHGRADPLGEEGIGAEGQMGTVLLDRPEGPHHRAAGPGSPLRHLGPAELAEQAAPRRARGNRRG